MRLPVPLAILIVGLLIIAAEDVIAAPTLTITSPPDGYVSNPRTINITGTASGSDARWVQTTQADFDAGIKDDVLSYPGGNFSLNRTQGGLYDDFNDDSLDPGRWTKDESSGITLSETNSEIFITGKGLSSDWAGRARLWSTKTFPDDISADLKAFSGSGTGYSAWIYLYQDWNNKAWLGADCDVGWAGDRIVGWWGYTKAGVSSEFYTNALVAGSHNFRISYDGGTVRYFIDGAQAASISLTLKDTEGAICGRTRYTGDTVSARWDDFMWGDAYKGTGNFTSSVFDAMAVDPVLKQVNYSTDRPNGTTVTVQVRSCDTSDMATATPWATVNSGQASGLPAVKRYLQYRVTLTSADVLTTPVFKDITIAYHVPIKKVEVSIDGQASWAPATGLEQWRAQIDLTQDRTTVWVKATDVAGDFTLASITVNLNATPPSGTVLINNGDEYTTSRDVTLFFNATGGSDIAAVIFSEDPGLSDSWWVPYTATHPFLLSRGDGIKTVYAKFKDVLGHESSIASDSILLDTKGPEGYVLINGDDEFTNSTNVTLAINATDFPAVTEMQVGNGPNLQNASWIPYRTSMAWELPPGDGEHKVYARFRDPAMLESRIENDSIVLDTVPPLVHPSINGGANYTRFRNVTLRLETEEKYRVESMQISPEPSFAGAKWGNYLPLILYDLPVGDGPKAVHARLRDFAGNTGPANQSSIILDTVAPSSGIDSMASEAGTDSFNVSWNGTDATSGIRWYDVQFRDGTGPWTDWLQRVDSTRSSFTGQEGHFYSFRVRAQDNAGNQEDYLEIVNGSVLVRPRFPVVSITFPGNGSTVKGLILANGTAGHADPGRAVVRVAVSLDGGGWVVADGTIDWRFQISTMRLGNGRHTLRARAFDGRVNSSDAESIFIVKNPRTDVSLEGSPYCLAAIFIALISVVLGGLFYLRRRGGPV